MWPLSPSFTSVFCSIVWQSTTCSPAPFKKTSTLIQWSNWAKCSNSGQTMKRFPRSKTAQPKLTIGSMKKVQFQKKYEIYVLADENGECNRLSWKCDDAIHCVPAWHVCDATPDCPDKSDEVGCPQDNPQTAAAPEVSSKIRSRYLLNFRLNCMFWTLLAKVSRRRRKKW